MATVSEINEIIHRKVSPRMELVRGEPMYFVYDDLEDSGTYEEIGVPRNSPNEMAVSDWVGLASAIVSEYEVTDSLGDIEWLH